MRMLQLAAAARLVSTQIPQAPAVSLTSLHIRHCIAPSC
jgi:hypothetical protein